MQLALLGCSLRTTGIQRRGSELRGGGKKPVGASSAQLRKASAAIRLWDHQVMPSSVPEVVAQILSAIGKRKEFCLCRADPFETPC